MYVSHYRSTYDMNNKHIVENFSLGDKIYRKKFYDKEKWKVYYCFKINHPNKYCVWLPSYAIWLFFYDWYAYMCIECDKCTIIHTSN